MSTYVSHRGSMCRQYRVVINSSRYSILGLLKLTLEMRNDTKLNQM